MNSFSFKYMHVFFFFQCALCRRILSFIKTLCLGACLHFCVVDLTAVPDRSSSLLLVGLVGCGRRREAEWKSTRCSLFTHQPALGYCCPGEQQPLRRWDPTSYCGDEGDPGESNCENQGSQRAPFLLNTRRGPIKPFRTKTALAENPKGVSSWQRAQNAWSGLTLSPQHTMTA